MRIAYPNVSRHLLPVTTVSWTMAFLSLFLLQGCQKELSFDMGAVDIKLIAEDLVSPIQIVTTKKSNRLYIVDQIGKVWVIDGSGDKRPVPLLDISSKLVSLNPAFDERGLLSLALHPDFANNGRIFIYYQLPPRAGGPAPGVSWNNLSRISEFTVSLNELTADLNSEKVILEWDDPQFNHNGGTLLFGYDNYLYISIGDGGGANDTGPGHVEDWYPTNAGGNAQDIESNFLGKILRIDIDAASPYGIPAANPFIDKPGRDEIFAFGFRNPYRMSFDMARPHYLIVADAGQNLWEEVNVISKGGNYGWNVKEGFHCFNAANNLTVLPSCPLLDNRDKEIIDPVLELNNWQNPQVGRATTIIGGHVYRGHNISGLNGKYVFGTFSQTPTTPNGELFMATMLNEVGPWPFEEVSLKSHPDDVGYYVRGFGQDEEGEIYIAVSSMPGPQGNTGKVFKLVAVPD